MRRNNTVVSLSRLLTIHLRTSAKFFSLRFLTSSFIEMSEKLASMPESILPPTAYLWHSLRTRRQSGKCLLMSSTKTLLSYLIPSASRISWRRLKNPAAISCRSFPLIPKSMTAHLECRGSMILFLYQRPQQQKT